MATVRRRILIYIRVAIPVLIVVAVGIPISKRIFVLSFNSLESFSLHWQASKEDDRHRLLKYIFGRYPKSNSVYLDSRLHGLTENELFRLLGPQNVTHGQFFEVNVGSIELNLLNDWLIPDGKQDMLRFGFDDDDRVSIILTIADGRVPRLTAQQKAAFQDRWPAPEYVPDPAIKKYSYDISSCIGIHDPESPNEELRSWHWSDWGKTNEISDDLLTAIEGGEQHELLFGRRDRSNDSVLIPGVLDLVPYELTPRLMNAVVENRKIKWLRVGALRSAEDFVWIGKLDQLLGLQIDDAYFANADFAKLANLEKLKWLSISWPKSFPGSFADWPSLPNLETLRLTGEIPDEFVSVFRNSKKLRSVSFSNTTIGDEGVRILVTNHPDLKYVNLYSSDVTSNSVDNLAKFKRAAHISVGITPLSRRPIYTRTIRNLERALPRCEISISN